MSLLEGHGTGLTGPAEITLLSETATNWLYWMALVGYLLVLLMAVPLMWGAVNGNYVVHGMVVFTLLIGLALLNWQALHIQGLSAIIMNLAWLTLLYQTGVFYGWYRGYKKWRAKGEIDERSN